MTQVSALILAGGRSGRFGRDKTATIWHGQTLLEQVVRLARLFSDDVIVLRAWARHELESAGSAVVRVLHDPEPYPGPLVALATGLVHVRHDTCLVLAADMPTVDARVVRRMVDAASADSTLSAVALEHERAAQPVPLVVRARFAYPYLTRIVSGGERKLRAALEIPGLRMIPERVWQSGDRRHATLRDIDTPADFADLLDQSSGSPLTAV